MGNVFGQNKSGTFLVDNRKVDNVWKIQDIFLHYVCCNPLCMTYPYSITETLFFPYQTGKNLPDWRDSWEAGTLMF